LTITNFITLPAVGNIGEALPHIAMCALKTIEIRYTRLRANWLLLLKCPRTTCLRVETARYAACRSIAQGIIANGLTGADKSLADANNRRTLAIGRQIANRRLCQPLAVVISGTTGQFAPSLIDKPVTVIVNSVTHLHHWQSSVARGLFTYYTANGSAITLAGLIRDIATSLRFESHRQFVAPADPIDLHARTPVAIIAIGTAIR